MSLKQKPASPRKTSTRFSHEEKGDPSKKVLYRTIGVCAVGLAVVVAFALSPRPKSTPPSPTAAARPEAKAPVATFDRASLSTKNR